MAKPNSHEQTIKMQKELIDSLNGHLTTIRKTAKSIRKIGNCIEILEQNGVCPENLRPIREYQSILAREVECIVNHALVEDDGE